jgi:carbamoyltransferase
MNTKPAYVLGINAYDHDVSACLLRDGAIVCAIAKERITRVKHASGFYQEVIDYCLEAEGIALDDISLIVRNCYILPVGDMERRLTHMELPFYLPDGERKSALQHPLFRATSNKVVTVSHHLAHAYSAFAACPFDEGAVMVVDGVGSYRADVQEKYPAEEGGSPLARESESYYRFSGTKLECLKKVWLEPSAGFLSDEFYNMPGLGAAYSKVSTYVFGDWNKCGELMGLAPYGRPRSIKPLVELKDGHLSIPQWPEDFTQPWFIESDIGLKWDNSPSMKHWEDVAWQIQDDTERVLLARAKWLRETTGARNLCIAGGVGLNCVANGKLARESGFDNVWIQPAAGDDGIAIGCAYYGHLALQNKPRSFVIDHAYFGKTYSEKEIAAETGKPMVRLVSKAIVSPDICKETAKILAEGNVVGWFQGGSEFGPRALGNRSILADPRDPKMKDILNSRVKHRQPFRPFAPIVLEERAAEIFEGRGDSPFMLMAKPVNRAWRNQIPAIVHVDGTARVQTVAERQNPRLYRLLKEFEALTGVPVLINTSFNVKGEPMVETPQDAIQCFLATGIDRLVLHDRVIRKTALHRVLWPAINLYSDVRFIVKSSMNPAPA